MTFSRRFFLRNRNLILLFSGVLFLAVALVLVYVAKHYSVARFVIYLLKSVIYFIFERLGLK